MAKKITFYVHARDGRICSGPDGRLYAYETKVQADGRLHETERGTVSLPATITLK